LIHPGDEDILEQRWNRTCENDVDDNDGDVTGEMMQEIW